MQDPRHILVIEDDHDIAQMLVLNLRAEGFDVHVAHNGEDGLAQVRQARPQLLVLDLMLPGMDGLDVCRRLREGADYLPIIVLSAKSSETQRVLGLELGADDYLTKPFSMAELVARVHAVMRRMQAAEHLAATRAGVLHHGRLRIDPIAREVHLGGRAVTLTSKEFDLLAFFARNAGRVFKRNELLDQVWGHAHDGYEHTVNSHINRLRNKIEDDPANPGYIRTIWGVGYKFLSPDDANGSAG
ncbi:response regulator transcription factor [Luteimonas salinilitoris]|uniref:Response regulator transcription factor n=1 Tax=Luteimonas salinilitoris TaxID=3237697 RepID=A0ABV4HQR2_9GAMM